MPQVHFSVENLVFLSQLEEDMSGVGTLAVCLLIVFLLSFLCLVTHLLCRSSLLYHRSRPCSAGIDLEHGGVDPIAIPSFSKRNFLINLHCLKIRSRIEPHDAALAKRATGAIAEEEEEDEYSLERLRAAAFGPSRTLCTISEEDIEGLDSDGENGGAAAGEDGNVDPFLTPSVSPTFYTPDSSPSRVAT
ncbi:hypothetical protein HPP92_006115 [Vanilla planifolia]|uniref:Uncharacterized protein n=1 Tax=Vanilla planifolia TaxID=51239 RepID=A0A835RUY8_VANPL|nr:hypothetical protein HPP92_006115 [Vanilla planifolia]